MTKTLFNSFFIRYCGHGSGQEYLGWDAMQRLHCKAVSLLMGCSSGKLVVSEISVFAHFLLNFMVNVTAMASNFYLSDVISKDIFDWWWWNLNGKNSEVIAVTNGREQFTGKNLQITWKVIFILEAKFNIQFLGLQQRPTLAWLQDSL